MSPAVALAFPLVIGLVGSIATSEDACSSGWFMWGSSCYKVVNDTFNFYKAQQACRSETSLLVSINSQQEEDFLSTIIRVEFWIGLYRVQCKPDSIFYWTDGSPYNYTNWDPGSTGTAGQVIYRKSASPAGTEPNENVCCQTMQLNKKWTDQDCYFKAYNFVCEKPLQLKRRDKVQKKATRHLLGSYLKPGYPLKKVVLKPCTVYKCFVACLDNVLCASFNIRMNNSFPDSRTCSCDLIGSESWLTLPVILQNGTSFYQVENYSILDEFKYL